MRRGYCGVSRGAARTTGARRGACEVVRADLREPEFRQDLVRCGVVGVTARVNRCRVELAERIRDDGMCRLRRVTGPPEIGQELKADLQRRIGHIVRFQTTAADELAVLDCEERPVLDRVSHIVGELAFDACCDLVLAVRPADVAHHLRVAPERCGQRGVRDVPAAELEARGRRGRAAHTWNATAPWRTGTPACPSGHFRDDDKRTGRSACPPLEQLFELGVFDIRRLQADRSADVFEEEVAAAEEG